jgi:hypothetical protein
VTSVISDLVVATVLVKPNHNRNAADKNTTPCPLPGSLSNENCVVATFQKLRSIYGRRSRERMERGAGSGCV